MASYQLLGSKRQRHPLSRLAPLVRSRAAVAAAVTVILGTLLLLLGTSSEVGKDAVHHGVEAAKGAGTRLKDWAWVRPAVDEDEYVQPSMEELARIVGENPKYLVKDGWATYGFNNQRYMLESTLLLAKIANRIPVLPDSIWARSCAVEKEVCEQNALRFFQHRNKHEDVVGSKWNDDGEAYKVGIEHFLDIPHLRRSYGPFLTYREFLSLYGIDPALYDDSLRWNTTNYSPPGFTTATMPEGLFQNRTFVRVDRPPPPHSTDGAPAVTDDKLDQATVELALGSRAAWTVQQARDALRKRGVTVVDDDDALVRRLEQFDVVPLYTFSDEVLMNKALARPSVELALRASVQPLSIALSAAPYANASIVYLAGNLHDQRKPGGLHFACPSAREEFVQLVLRGIRAPRQVRTLGAELARRMEERVSGRRWLAAHLRRGDFVGIKWSPSADAVVHFEKTKEALEKGVGVLGEHYEDRLPLPDDPFYLATDESNATSLAYYRSHGAVLLSDLFTPQDAATLGWTASYSDVLAVVEQQVLARSDFFVGSELSSTSGGAINDRTALGREEWSWALLGRH
ncbi:hypothetical protein JCM10450v2_001068 [Rhodotorula kratochvilovae]